MQKHFFTFRKTVQGKPQIDIEVVVAGNITRAEARRIANEEIEALREGHALTVHAALRGLIQRMEKGVTKIPDYRFLGVN
jgi:hypothetical protein